LRVGGSIEERSPGWVAPRAPFSQKEAHARKGGATSVEVTIFAKRIDARACDGRLAKRRTKVLPVHGAAEAE